MSGTGDSAGRRPPTEAEFAEAYSLHEAEEQRREAAGNPGVGYKVACTNETAQRNVGVVTPCYARIFRSNARVSPAVIPVRSGWPCGAECELGVIFARDVAPGEDARAAIGELCVAMEIVEDRYNGIGQAGGANLVADGFAHRAFILGTPRPYRGEALDAFQAEMRLDGAVVHRAISSSVLGDPANALAWLQAALAARGRMLRAGDIVLTGSITPPYWIPNLPAEAECTIEGFGALKARFEPQQDD